MAHSYLNSMLGERERIIYTARQHWFLLLSSIFLEIILILIFLAVTVTLALLFTPYALIIVVLGFALILIPIATLIRDVLSWSSHQYIITNRRVIQIAGVFDKTVTDSSLEKVNDIKMSQSALGRIFDFGDVEILTASELGVNRFSRIEHPVHFKTALLNAKEQLEGHIPEAPEAPAPVAPDSPAALLTQLDTLRRQGILTEAEFAEKKAHILSRM